MALHLTTMELIPLIIPVRAISTSGSTLQRESSGLKEHSRLPKNIRLDVLGNGRCWWVNRTLALRGCLGIPGHHGCNVQLSTAVVLHLHTRDVCLRTRCYSIHASTIYITREGHQRTQHAKDCDEALGKRNRKAHR